MDIVILAGGYAQRLWPLTEEFPKALLAIAGKPVLQHVLEAASRVSNVTNIVVAIDSGRLEPFRKVLDGIRRETGIRLELSVHKEGPKGQLKSPLEKIAEILDASRDLRLSEGRLLIVGADNVFGFELSRFAAFQRARRFSAIAIHRREKQVDASEFGVPTVNHAGRLVAFEEKPAGKSAYGLISTACYLLRRADAALVTDYLSQTAEDTLGSYIRWLQSRVTIEGFIFDDPWFDVGTRDGLLSANRFLLESDEIYRRHPTIVSGSTDIRGSVHIAEGVVLQDSVVGPNVYVAPGSTVVRSSVANSIIYEGSRLIDCEVEHSVVGASSVIEGRVSEAVFGPRSRIATRR
jgi:glucose-1-phosphate thymidylyltransferase